MICGIEALVLFPLVHHHFGVDGNETQGQAYLHAFVLIAEESSIYKGSYLPPIKAAPVYPRQFIVDADGRVRDPAVIEESPKGVFGAAAIEGAKSFRYVPKVVDGVLVSTAGVRNKITFELR